MLVDVLPPLRRTRIDEVVRGKEEEFHAPWRIGVRQIGHFLERPILGHVAFEGGHVAI